MNWSEIRAEIETFFAQAWVADGEAKTPIQWENFLFDPQFDSEGLPQTVAPFLRLTMIEMARTSRVSGVHEYEGSLVIQAFSEAGKGPADVSGLIDSVDLIFKNKVIYSGDEEISFSDCRITDKTSIGLWFFITLEFPFKHESD